MTVHDPRIVERWRTIVVDWRRSELGVAAFCRSRRINKSGFHRWRNILDQLDRSSTTPSSTAPAPAFVPVRVVPDPVIEVILPSGLQLRVPLSVDARQRACLVLALGTPPC